ncbi:MAG TPA: response regulator transcription factor [Chloroflexota bacterium]|jgi:DNA-binding response OmpR family regulator
MAAKPHKEASAPTRVLVLLDQPYLAELIKLTLNHGVYVARDAPHVSGALALMKDWTPEVMVLDMDSGGNDLLARMGMANATTEAHVPVLALTRRGDLKSKLAAFDQGVDDIMVIPFSPEELLARVLAMTRRAYGRVPQLTPVLKIGEIEIDILNRTVTAGGHELHLTGLEQSLLYLLAANPGRVVTRWEIIDALWGTDHVAGSNIVDRHIRNLRAKLQNDWHRPRFITTVSGRGYRWDPTFTGQETEPPPLQHAPQARNN